LVFLPIICSCVEDGCFLGIMEPWQFAILEPKIWRIFAVKRTSYWWQLAKSRWSMEIGLNRVPLWLIGQSSAGEGEGIVKMP
jgi:hypothetical protein